MVDTTQEAPMRHGLRSKLTYSNVVSTICLAILVGGGTAIAASNSKAIKKVVTSLAPGLSVNHSKSADSATDVAQRRRPYVILFKMPLGLLLVALEPVGCERGRVSASGRI